MVGCPLAVAAGTAMRWVQSCSHHQQSLQGRRHPSASCAYLWPKNNSSTEYNLSSKWRFHMKKTYQEAARRAQVELEFAMRQRQK